MNRQYLLITVAIAAMIALTACSSESKADGETSVTTESIYTEEVTTTVYDAEAEQLKFEMDNLPKEICYSSKEVTTQSVAVRNSSNEVVDYLQKGDRVYFTGVTFDGYSRIVYFIDEKQLEGWVYNNPSWFN
jgi:hypothetical protein